MRFIHFTSNKIRPAFYVLNVVLLQLASPICSTSQSNCDSLLVAFYDFEGNVQDHSGLEHHGISDGNAVVSGNLVIPLDNASAAYLPNLVLQGAEDFSVSCRVKFNEFQVNGSDPINVIINGFSSNNAFVIGYRKAQNIVHLTFSGAGTDVPLPTQLVENQWYCFQFTRQGSVGKVFVDGLLAGGNVAISSSPLEVDALVVGQDQDCLAGCFAANQSLAGHMDNLRIFRRALQADEVASFCKTSTETAMICEGGQFEGHETSGEYAGFFETANACDSMRVLKLVVNPAQDTAIEMVVCAGESFLGLNETGNHTLVFQNQFGCDSILRINLRVEKGVFAPNAFSPNDDGINDNFTLFGNGEEAAITNLKIFNRWGALVFEAPNIQAGRPESGWNGNFEGKPCQTGIYAWFAEVNLLCGKTRFFEGDLLLIR